MADVPKTKSPIQVAATRFRSAVSESLLQLLSGNINYLLDAVPVGTVLPSMLTEAQFQDIATDDWILADGRSVGGSEYETITGDGSVPDLRGIFLRGKNNGRTTSEGNSAGDVSLGTFSSDAFAAHTHLTNSTLITDTSPANTGDIEKDEGSEFSRTNNPNTGSQGSGTETKPRNVTVNYFIRIN